MWLIKEVIMKFLHAMIRVKNIEESLRFYKDFLDLKIISKGSLEDCDLYYMGEDSDSCQIELTYNYETPKDGYDNGNCFGHFAFAVDDMDKITEKAKQMGYEFLWEPFDLELKDAQNNVTVKKIAFIKDPDGNEIELIKK